MKHLADALASCSRLHTLMLFGECLVKLSTCQRPCAVAASLYHLLQATPLQRLVPQLCQKHCRNGLTWSKSSSRVHSHHAVSISCKPSIDTQATGNDLKDEGVAALAMTSKTCPKLRKLNLSGEFLQHCASCFVGCTHNRFSWNSVDCPKPTDDCFGDVVVQSSNKIGAASPYVFLPCAWCICGAHSVP